MSTDTIAFSYLRFSSKAQELGDSVRRQKHLAEAYASEQGWQLDTRSFEDLGLSAFRGKNVREGALGAFLKAVDEHKIPSSAVLLVENLDRVTRAEVMDALEIFTGIINRGITLVTINDKQHYSRSSIKNNPTQLIMSILTMVRANEESATKSKRIKQAWQAKRDLGVVLTSRCPSWLEKRKGYAGRACPAAWTVLPEKVRIIRKIFEWGASGLGSTAIAQRLNEMNAPTMGSAVYWNALITRKFMSNSAVIGRFTSKYTTAEPIDDYFPQVVKPELFYLTQEHMQKRAGSGGPSTKGIANIFRGLMYCECGQRMRFVSMHKQKGFGYVQCKDSYSNVKCNASRVPYHQVEDHMLFWFSSLTDIDVNLRGRFKANSNVARRGELEAKKKVMDGMIEAFGDLVSRGVTVPALVKSIEKLQGEIDVLSRTVGEVVVPLSKDSMTETAEMYDKHKQRLKEGGPETRFTTVPSPGIDEPVAQSHGVLQGSCRVRAGSFSAAIRGVWASDPEHCCSRTGST